MATFDLRHWTLRFWLCGLCLGASVFLAGATPTAAADGQAIPLEEALQQAAPQIIQTLRLRGGSKVGVLKFRVFTGRTLSDRGTLNSYMADRLETALILANPVGGANEIRLVRQASAVATEIPGASHLSVFGRKLLFDANYHPAWGRGEIRVDAFVTGVVHVAPDFRTLRLSFLAVQPGAEGLRLLIDPLKVATNGAILNELGESYQLRGGNGPQSPADAVREVRSDPAANFPLRSNPDVLLQVLYDGQPVEFKPANGEMSIPEPRAGQTVSLRITRRNTSDVEFGAVLKVNGENVLFRQREPDINCTKYLLKPGCDPITVEGYQLANDGAQAFSVASAVESKALEMYYGRDVGTISLTVFRTAAAPVPELPPDLAAIAKAGVPIEGAEDLPTLQRQIREEAGEGRSRGVLKPGEHIRNKVDWQKKRNWEPEPFLSAVIRYYRPEATP